MDRGWPVIFTDLKREYVAEFYRPGIDFLFNVGDARCVNWRLDREFTNALGARSLTQALSNRADEILRECQPTRIVVIASQEKSFHSAFGSTLTLP